MFRSASGESTGTSADTIQLPEDLLVGHGSVVGYGQGLGPAIGRNVSIGCFCVVSRTCAISDDVEIDHYCRVGEDVKIGIGTKILYGCQLFNGSSVGSHSIIGGNLSERVIVQDSVTFMGSIAHSHRNASLDWDTTDEPSPVFEEGCVVGADALIVGGVTIGRGSYVAAREIVRSDVPPFTFVGDGGRRPLAKMRGFVQSRLPLPEN